MKEQREERDGNVRARYDESEQVRGNRGKGVAAAGMKRMKRAREDESVRTKGWRRMRRRRMRPRAVADYSAGATGARAPDAMPGARKRELISFARIIQLAYEYY